MCSRRLAMASIRRYLLARANLEPCVALVRLNSSTAAARDLRKRLSPPRRSKESAASGIDARALLQEIRALEAKQDGRGVIELVRRAAAEDRPRNAITYNSAISALGKCGMAREALSILQLMRDDGWQPCVVSFSAAIDNFSRLQRKRNGARGALALLQTMKEAQVRPNVVTYTSVIHACARHFDQQGALQVLKMMREDVVKPNVLTYNACLDACAQRGHIGDARKLMREMQELDKVKANEATWNIYLKVLVRCKDLAGALAALDRMAEEGIRPSLTSYNTCIRACADAGDTDTAMALLQRLRSDGLSPDAYIFTTLITAFGRSGDARTALGFLDEMARSDVKQTVPVFTACVAACGGDWKLALEVHERAVEHLGTRGLGSSLLSCISSCLDAAKRWSEAEALYEVYARAGVVRPWASRPAGDGVVVDLHDHTLAMTRSALKYVFREVPTWLEKFPGEAELVFVTGRGNGSIMGVPVLKATAMSLVRALFPPLEPLDVRWNPGRFSLSREALVRWRDANQAPGPRESALRSHSCDS